MHRPEPMKNSAELLEKFQRGRRRVSASILDVLLIDAMTENLDEDEKQELESVKRSFAWGLSSSVEALNEKTSALLSTLHYFDKVGKGFISRSDLARVSESFGKHMSESELNEMLVGDSGDPEQNESSVEAIDSEVATQALLCRARSLLANEKFNAAEEDYKKY
ncbi:hypothetical protein PsorP6_001974 [Peronosclerospora sorghi]|uniref:Uncharacterized protein n=1 Tax=Peronosclerospora sorghi TaxID=230839 RepID=A0ACC0WX69_9STRA|nr:hypothetical protein PsorP6_001974 [Peronosclerospora sorghi]